MEIATQGESGSGSVTTVPIGAIVQATGSTPYDPSNLPQYGYGKSKDIVANREMEALAKAANGVPIKRPSDGKEVKAACFVQNVGQNSLECGEASDGSILGTGQASCCVFGLLD